jgi:hypothetical protein
MTKPLRIPLGPQIIIFTQSYILYYTAFALLKCPETVVMTGPCANIVNAPHSMCIIQKCVLFKICYFKYYLGKHGEGIPK